MAMKLLVRDETATGNVTGERVIEFLEEVITVEELIRSRVYQEVKEYNTRKPEYFKGLIEPSDAEKHLNGVKLPKRREVNWKKQFELALEAFKGNGFFILVDDRQVEELDEKVELKMGTRVSFIKLIPMVGG